MGKKEMIINKSVENFNFKLGYLIGFVRGDGHINSKYWRVIFYNNNGNILRRIEDYLKELFNIIPSYYEGGNGGTTNLIVSHKEFTLFINSLCQTIKQQSSEFKRGFICGFFDAEGTLGSGSGLFICNSSIELIRIVQKILIEFGFICRVYSHLTKSFCSFHLIRMYRIYLPNRELWRFLFLFNPCKKEIFGI